MDFFFLQAFADSAEDAIHTIDYLTALHDKSTKLFDALTKRQRTSVLKVFAYLESNPIIDIQKTSTALEMSYNTVSRCESPFWSMMESWSKQTNLERRRYILIPNTSIFSVRTLNALTITAKSAPNNVFSQFLSQSSLLFYRKITTNVFLPSSRTKSACTSAQAPFPKINRLVNK